MDFAYALSNISQAKSMFLNSKDSHETLRFHICIGYGVKFPARRFIPWTLKLWAFSRRE